MIVIMMMLAFGTYTREGKNIITLITTTTAAIIIIIIIK